ncbi:MAG: NAD(P)-binding protein [Candidatus Methylacidiphilales bacterium]|nr:NAD(P)-binding protein [Candidatus Methylacidiphilales bacterium]
MADITPSSSAASPGASPVSSNMLTRREFLVAGAGALAAGIGISAYHSAATWPEAKPTFGGSILGAGSSTGHLLRTGVDSFPIATEEQQKQHAAEWPAEVEIAIIGGGMAALTAAWQLRRRGHHNFRILELEDHIGGNSSWGQNAESAYPWGAHYVPLLNDETEHLVPLFEELGIIEGHAQPVSGEKTGAPIYNEHYLCFAPQERIFFRGLWREGLEPRLGYLNTAADGSILGTAAEEERQFADFHAAMESYRLAVGSDGRRAFAIPLDFSSADAAFRDLDQISMAQLMQQRGWTCTALHWYVNYGCRDDYGTMVEHTSAWAGIHYFASRSARIANGDPHLVLTWPEGNGWLARRLRDLATDTPQAQDQTAAAEKSGGAKRIQTGALVYSIEQEVSQSTADGSARWRVDYLDVATKTRRVLKAAAVIVATPRFIATRIVKALREQAPAPTHVPNPAHATFTYAPWMVANITMQGLPQGAGSQLAWDNVLYNSDSLGYVMATHQRLERFIPRTVLTYYHPLSKGTPAEERTRALSRTWESWRDDILADLSRAHPGITAKILHMDVWLWGHGMIRPTPGFIWGGAREAAVQSPLPSLAFAHADYSGISIFEEASWHGMRSANAIADHLAKARAV